MNRLLKAIEILQLHLRENNKVKSIDTNHLYYPKKLIIHIYYLVIIMLIRIFVNYIISNISLILSLKQVIVKHVIMISTT